MSHAICHVVYNRYPADPRVRRETLALMNAGFRVDVISVLGAQEVEQEAWRGIQVRRLPMQVVRGNRSRYVFQYTLLFLLTAAVLLATYYRRRYQVIHVHSLPDFLIFAALPCRLFGARLILDLHESFPELLRARFPNATNRLVLPIVELAQVASCRFADHVITVNERIRAVLIGRGVPERAISVVENSPDWVDSFPAGDASTKDFTTSTPRIVIAAGLNRERDFVTLLRAAEKVHRAVPFELHIYGRGDATYVQEINQLARDLGLDSCVSFKAEVPAEAVPDLLRNTAIGVVTYERNPLTQLATPNKVYEYSALGKPMVVADLHAMRELLNDSVLYYDPGNSDDLAFKILQLLTDSSARKRFGAKSQAFARGHAWSVTAHRLQSLYLELAR